MGKSKEEIASIAKDVINLLAKNECTIEDTNDVFRIAKLSIDNTSMVRQLPVTSCDWLPCDSNGYHSQKGKPIMNPLTEN